MKRLSLLLLAILTIGSAIYLVSCKKEKAYSCDEGLNDYATITMSKHQSISRYNIAKLGIDTQFAIFNSLSFANKIRIMNEKIQSILNIDTVSSTDKIHLKKMSDHLLGKTDEIIDKDTFINNWKAYAYERLQWDETKMGIYLYTWLLPSEIMRVGSGKASVFTVPTNESGGGTSQLSCKCSWSWVCGAWRCADGGCDKTDSGCGFLCLYACTGDCKPQL
jgi:hypothetical protein